MQIYPAIDIQRGRVVRALEGGRGGEAVYAPDAVAQAERFVAAGATWLHLVDLDRAFNTGGDNTALVRRIAMRVGARVQVGGLLRTAGQVGAALEAGAARAVVATATAVDPAELAALVRRFGPERLALAVDVRAGRPVLRGSASPLEHDVAGFGRAAADAGLRTVVYRNLDRDGLLGGFDVPGACALSGAREVIIAGGGAGLEDLAAARDAGLAGAIVGRALYEGRFTLEEAIACCG